MRKFLCAILCILILGCSVITQDFLNIFTFAQSNVISSNSTNIYPQNLYFAKQYSENFDNIFVGTDSSSYARTYYNNMLNDDAFITGIVTWESIHITTSPSYSLESGMVTKTDFYRTALFDYLTVQIESGSTGEYFENIYKQVKNEYTSFIVSSTKTIMGKEKNISANELKTLKLTEDRKQLLLNGTWLGQTASTISDVMKILEWAKNFYDAVELVAKYCALTDLHDGTKEILSYIANDTSNPLDLRIAAQDCAECMGDSYLEVLEAMLNGSYSAFFDVLGDYMDLGWNKLMTKIPGANIVFLGAKGIRAIANLFDSKDEKVKAYYQIEASVKCEDAILKAMSAYRSKFDSNKTQKNAVLYLKAAEMYKSVVLLGYDYSVDLLNIVNNSTSALIFNQTEDCTALIKDIKAFKTDKQSNYERFDSATLNAYKETYFPDYDTVENAVSVEYVCPFSYIVSNSSVTLTKYNGSETTVRIPELINNYPVTSIGDKAFYSCKSLVSVTLPDTISSIGNLAFCFCESLESINISNVLTSIGEHAFQWCYSLASITIPDSVTSIGEHAFYSCDSLTNVYITDIAAWCNIDFADFASNPLHNTGNLYLNGELVTDLVIPDSVTSIGDNLFRCCDSLTSVTISDSVKSIGSYAFDNCDSLTDAIIGDSVISIGKHAFYSCDSLTNVSIGDGVTSTGIYTFYDCDSLTDIIIGDSVTTIDNYTFYDCDSLVSITIPNSVTKIAYRSFAGCSSLEKVTLNNGLKTICEEAFTKCEKITDIYIPKSVTSIDRRVFDDCYSLKAINVSAENEWYSSVDGVLFNKDETYLIRYPAGKIQKSYEIPYGTVSMTGVLGEHQLPEEFLEDDPLYGAFSDCKFLKEVIIPETLTAIGYYAFTNCENLEKVIISDTVKRIGSYAFYDCSKLKDINIPHGVEGIGERAFYNCSDLENIFLPDTVKDIYGQCTFGGCTNLLSVSFGENTRVSSPNCFLNSPNVTLICPYGSYADIMAQNKAINRIIIGDYNQDYIVNAFDMSVMRKYLMALIESEQPDMVISDCNRDSTFDIRDLIRLKKQLVA